MRRFRWFVAILPLAVGCGGSSRHGTTETHLAKFVILPTTGSDAITVDMSPDGTRLLAIDFQTGKFFLFNRDGESITIPHDSLDAASAFTKDGSGIVGYASGSAAIYTFGSTTRLLPSPDGFESGTDGVASSAMADLANANGSSGGTFPYVVVEGKATLLPGLIADTINRGYRLSKEGFVVVGFSGSKPVRWTNRASPTPSALSEEVGVAYSLSRDGSVIVGELDLNDVPVAFRWTSETGATKLPLPKGAVSSRATAVSEDGKTVLGTAYEPDGDGYLAHPFVWTKKYGSQRIEDLVDFNGPSFGGLTDVTVNAVSTDGKVVGGQGRVADRHLRGYVLTLP